MPAPPETIDLAAAITKKDACQAAEQVAYVKKRHPEVIEIFGDFKFRGQEQKKTPARHTSCEYPWEILNYLSAPVLLKQHIEVLSLFRAWIRLTWLFRADGRPLHRRFQAKRVRLFTLSQTGQTLVQPCMLTKLL